MKLLIILLLFATPAIAGGTECSNAANGNRQAQAEMLIVLKQINQQLETALQATRMTVPAPASAYTELARRIVAFQDKYKPHTQPAE